MVRRVNATLCADLSKFVQDEAYWDNHVAFKVLPYNCSRHDAMEVTLFRALMGVEA